MFLCLLRSGGASSCSRLETLWVARAPRAPCAQYGPQVVLHCFQMRGARAATVAALVLFGLQVAGDVRADPDTVADEPDTSAWRLPKLPDFKGDHSDDWYPDVARRLELEGRVLLGFDIGVDGRARNISVIWSENSVFAASADEILKSARFNVPSD